MTKEMLISSNGHETRVAILEDDLVAEIFVERERSRGVVGNVYKGRVSKVLPGMQSAFIELGLERDGFLYVSDVVASFEEFDRLDTEDDDAPSLSAMAGQGHSPANRSESGQVAAAGNSGNSPGLPERLGGVPPSGIHKAYGQRGNGGRRDRDRDREKG